MQNPLEITFHDITNHPKINEIIKEKFEKVQTIAPDVTKCHVVIEKPAALVFAIFPVLGSYSYLPPALQKWL